MIYEKLAKIQQELKAPKGQFNSFGKYSYRSCEDILEAVKPLLEKHKCTLLISDNIENVGERYYIRAQVMIYDYEDGSSTSNTAYAREEETKKGMDGSQITGASSSYARKYALNGLFAIDDTKDSDATNDGTDDKPKREEKKNTDKKATEKQIEAINKLYDAENIQKMLEYYKINSLSDMPMDQASKAIERKMKK